MRVAYYSALTWLTLTVTQSNKTICFLIDSLSMPDSTDSDSAMEPVPPSVGLDTLADLYWDAIAPAMRDDGLDPESDRPTYEWLNQHGYRGFIHALSEGHDKSFGEFWTDYLDTSPQGYEWGIDHSGTVEALERYLDRQKQRKSWSESTVDAHRSRLARYARAYGAVNGSDDLLTPVARESDVSPEDAVDACWATFDALDEDLSRETLRRIYISVSDWYSTLVSRREAALNPTDGLDYNWHEADAEASDNPALEPDHVAALFEAADEPRERMLVIALAAWGLRTSEVAGLHVDQLVLEDGDPRIEFDERKNGPGSVALIYGEDVLDDYREELPADGESYLFPSTRSESGHVSDETIRNWFGDLVDRADIPTRIRGERPTPQMARRFWYQRYSSTVEELVDHQIQEVAEEQGSASADVVWTDYLDEDRRRDLRRQFMRDRLADAFE